MKAYIKIDNSNQEELGNFLSVDSERIMIEYFSGYRTATEICFDLDKIYKKGTEINMNGNVGIVLQRLECF